MADKPQSRHGARTIAPPADSSQATCAAAAGGLPVLDLLQRLQAFEAIQNSAGRLAVAADWRQPEAVLQEFALDRPEVCFEYADEGVFRGEPAIRAAVFTALQPLKTGEMLEMQVASPMIEVAQDLKSARALFATSGYGAAPQQGGLPVATWNWGTLAADYVLCAEASWKILNAHYFRFIECSYQGGFVDDLSRIHRSHPMHPMAEATTYHHPYSPLAIRQAIPAAPQPYESYNGSGWMLGKD